MKFDPKPLTKAEKAWIASAQRLFDRCPVRFEFMTMGDARLTIIDKTFSRESVLADGAAAEDGIVLGDIDTKNLVHGVSG